MSEKYNLKVAQSLVDVFQKYLESHPELGYTFVSSFMRELLRDKAKELIEEMKENKGQKEKKKRILIPEGKYTREELLELLGSK